MAGVTVRELGPVLTITVAVHSKAGRSELVLTTWGIRSGRYGSLGRVTRPLGSPDVPTDLEDLAALVLTALYGLDYDL